MHVLGLRRRQLQGRVDAVGERGHKIEDKNQGRREHHEREKDKKVLSGIFETLELADHVIGKILFPVRPC